MIDFLLWLAFIIILGALVIIGEVKAYRRDKALAEALEDLVKLAVENHKSKEKRYVGN